MFMVTDTLRVGLLTDHVPVKDIATHITSELIEEKVNTVYQSLKKDFRNAVMRPTIQKIKETGKLVFGPYAADSFFGSDNYKSFDAIIASYHDQGLIPFKTLSFGQGVNFTAGLSKVRTSPDHGTAYEIAGKGKADTGSFKEAIFTGISIFRNRNEYGDLVKDPLKITKRKQVTNRR